MLSYDLVGSGNPVLLIHSGITDRRMWQPQIRPLSSNYRLYVIDLPGFGRSLDPCGPPDLASEVEQFIESEIAERVTVIACSFGAEVALKCAIRKPNLTGPLLLAGTLAGMETPTPELTAIWDQSEAALERGRIRARGRDRNTCMGRRTESNRIRG